MTVPKLVHSAIGRRKERLSSKELPRPIIPARKSERSLAAVNKEVRTVQVLGRGFVYRE